jgi:hypothetical protein
MSILSEKKVEEYLLEVRSFTRAMLCKAFSISRSTAFLLIEKLRRRGSLLEPIPLVYIYAPAVFKEDKGACKVIYEVVEKKLREKASSSRYSIRLYTTEVAEELYTIFDFEARKKERLPPLIISTVLTLFEKAMTHIRTTGVQLVKRYYSDFVLLKPDKVDEFLRAVRIVLYLEIPASISTGR